MNRNMRLALLGALVAAAAVAFVIAKPGQNNNSSSSGSPSSKPQAASKPIQIEVRAGKPLGGIRALQVNRGARVRFAVSSDVADEIHVHGYDLKRDVARGGTVAFDFPAKIDGVFEIELERRKQQIAELRVAP